MLRSYLTAVCSEYSFIEHNKDELASGVLKTDHIHAVYVKGSRTRVITEINYLQKALGYTDSERGLISVDTCGSYERSLRYLIHKDDPMKHQYDVGEIITNLDGKLISEIMTAECIRDELNIDELIKIVLTCNGLRSAIYSTIGLKYSVRYGKIIDNLIKEYYGKTR
ncbi:MAG: replication protein [Bacilli bacterium]|nr:replication protein [Bacilli bacterium]